jgi:hypothetical protein
MEAEFQAWQEAQEARWRAERDQLQASLDTALGFMRTMGSAIGLSPPAVIPTPTPPTPIQLTPVRNLTINAFSFNIET